MLKDNIMNNDDNGWHHAAQALDELQAFVDDQIGKILLQHPQQRLCILQRVRSLFGDMMTLWTHDLPDTTQSKSSAQSTDNTPSNARISAPLNGDAVSRGLVSPNVHTETSSANPNVFMSPTSEETSVQIDALGVTDSASLKDKETQIDGAIVSQSSCGATSDKFDAGEDENHIFDDPERVQACAKSNRRRKPVDPRFSITAQEVCSLLRLNALPFAIADPMAISSSISSRLSRYEPDRVLFLTRLFYAIASPAAVNQLSSACGDVRQRAGNQRHLGDFNVSDCMQALDVLDAEASVISILHRYYLLRLATQRNALRLDYRLRDTKLQPRKLKYDYQKLRVHKANEGYGRASVGSLREVLLQAYPELARLPRSAEVYKRRLTSLKNRLFAAQKWTSLAQEFSPGILAVVPIVESWRISNTSIESLRQGDFKILLELLREYRGRFLRDVGSALANIYDVLLRTDSEVRFPFEDISSLEQCSPDSPSLLAACKAFEAYGAETTKDRELGL